MIPKLKQPTKFTHTSLEKQPQTPSSQQYAIQPAADSVLEYPKTKPIKKLPNKKQINKKNQPSALRLAAINETFHKIQSNANTMAQNFNVDKQLLNELLECKEKFVCQCGRNVKYYCLKCMQVCQKLATQSVQLPFQMRVLHHESQKINKSSIAPMSLLSKQIQLQTFTSKSQPNQTLHTLSPKQTCILFPHKESKTVSETDFTHIKNIVVLDCTWFQTDQLVSCLQKRGFQNYVRLEDYQSLFWRYNHHSDKALSSGEALAYFLREYQQLKTGEVKKYDGVMLLYLLNLKIVEGSYRNQGHEKEDKEEKDEKEEKEEEQQKQVEQQVKVDNQHIQQ